MRRARAGFLMLAVGWALAGGSDRAEAQAPAPQGAEDTALASPLISPDHWSHLAARRLQGVGLLPAALPPRSATTGRAMAALLRVAGEEAERAGSPLAALVAGWSERLREEFPEVGEEAPGGIELLHGAAGGSLRGARGQVSPGRGEFPPDRTGPEPRGEPPLLEGGLDLALALGSRVSLDAGPRLDGEGARLAHADLSATLGAWSLALGRREVAFGYSAGGSPVLGGASLDRVQLATARPLVPPGPLALLGPITFHTFLSRLDGDRHPGSPYFWGASGAVHPHPRFAIEVHRAALIGGDGITEPVTALALLKGLVGKHSEVENQIVSVEGRLRLPTEALLPLTAYCEFGAEDSSGSFYRVPGLVCGGLAPAVPGAEGLALGVEAAFFGEKCCGNPGWYRHRQFLGSWATESAPLGHPLGGDGSEVRAYSSLDLLQGRVGTRASAFRRSRGADNLFVPGREGDSFGLSGALAWRLGRRGDLHLSAFLEEGEEWSERGLTLTTRVLF